MRTRLTVAVIALVVVTVALTSAGSYVLIRRATVQTAQQELAGEARAISTTFSDKAGLTKLSFRKELAVTWTYGPAGWIDDLNEYIKDPAKTNPNYAWDDVLPGLRSSTAWNGKPGGALGSPDAKQWCIPWGYELNSVT